MLFADLNNENSLIKSKEQLVDMDQREDRQVSQYLEYIQKLHERISEREQRTGITRWALLGGVAYIAWQSVPMFAKLKEAAEPSWTYLWLNCSYLTTLSFFVFFLYQSLGISRHVSPYSFRQTNATARAGKKLSLLIIFVSFFPAAFLSFQAWLNIPELSDLNYRFLSSVSIFLLFVGTTTSGAVIYIDKYVKKNGFWPPFVLIPAGNSVFSIQLFICATFICMTIYYFLTGLRYIPATIFEPVLLLSGSIALIPPCLEVILSGIHRQERLSVLEILERDILMHDLSSEEIKNRLEDDLIGCELGDWAKRQVEQVRSANTLVIENCKDVKNIIKQIMELDPSLKFERAGRISNCINKIDETITKLNTNWLPLHNWLASCKNQPFKDPYIAKVVDSTLNDLSPLINSSVNMARESINLLKQRLAEIEKE
ncbi:hypothetical protein [Quatrionicoccus australiensis]|uniref:hypothetical protein n=1 Tax=Quatrionicoccus australiensis TaxID=138118 RepID=UPI001CF9D6FB|nr:hypothetical protein [Quatrionicoccus australiensis]MCB4358790.1 hypothetical protein [Quatrionicoccus australiensis]